MEPFRRFPVIFLYLDRLLWILQVICRISLGVLLHQLKLVIDFMDKDDFLLKRIRELANLSYQRDIVTFTDFLNLNEQNMLATLKLRQMGVSVKLFGGYNHAERQMAAFYPGTVGFSWEYPIDCLKIIPKALRFSEELGHRDYLGAILNLGVDRSVVGDILIKDKEAWVFCLHKMSDFFIDNLVRVRHTTVLVTRVEQAEEIPEPQFEAISGTCASVRLDSLIGLAFQTSRSSMVSFIESGLVFVNGKLITSNGYEPKEGDIISVRGKGRFIYDGVSRQTKKGGLGVRLRKYI